MTFFVIFLSSLYYYWRNITILQSYSGIWVCQNLDLKIICQISYCLTYLKSVRTAYTNSAIMFWCNFFDFSEKCCDCERHNIYFRQKYRSSEDITETPLIFRLLAILFANDAHKITSNHVDEFSLSFKIAFGL